MRLWQIGYFDLQDPPRNFTTGWGASRDPEPDLEVWCEWVGRLPVILFFGVRFGHYPHTTRDVLPSLRPHPDHLAQFPHSFAYTLAVA